MTTLSPTRAETVCELVPEGEADSPRVVVAMTEPFQLFERGEVVMNAHDFVDLATRLMYQPGAQNRVRLVVEVI